jgi:hypothetical protein
MRISALHRGKPKCSKHKWFLCLIYRRKRAPYCDGESLPAPPQDQHERQQFLMKQLRAVNAFITQLNGGKSSFDTESLALYDAVSPPLTTADLTLLWQNWRHCYPQKFRVKI